MSRDSSSRVTLPGVEWKSKSFVARLKTMLGVDWQWFTDGGAEPISPIPIAAGYHGIQHHEGAASDPMPPFQPLAVDPLQRRISGPSGVEVVEGRRRTPWQSTVVRRRKFVWLLNRCVCQHAFERHLSLDEKGRFYFRPVPGSEDSDPQTRFHQFRDGTKPRAVAARKTSPKDGSVFWVHYAAKIRVELIGERFFLRIEPAFVFTHDGREAIGGKTRAELDALIAHLYGLTKAEFAYILDTFPVLRRKELAAFGEYQSKRKALEEFERFSL